MLTTILLSTLCAAAGDTYAIQWESSANAAQQLTLEDGQTYKRVERIGKRHLRTAFSLRATALAGDRVRLDADLHGAASDKPVHVSMVTKLDHPTTLQVDGGNAIKVRVRKLPEAVATTEFTSIDLVAP
ncbi:MAG: hypothetical protein IT381_15585 [Deltaproteobacteria bacterium]|nr:hypothetical protein [Deltaproteobacteria bacterium]